MKVPHLMSIRPMECWLATPNASSPAMSYALEQTKAARIGVICQGASSAPHFLLARLQGYSFQFVFQVVFPAYTLQLPSCVLPTAFKTFCSNKLGILTGTSWHSAFKTFCSTKLGILSGRRWHFSNVSSDITGPPDHESTSLDVNKAHGMLTSHAKRIFSGNVTCFGTNKSCSNRSHLSGCFKCSSLLACKAPRVQLSICFPSSLSRIHLAASLLCSADCFQDILFEQAGNSHWNKLAFCFQNILFDKTGNSLWKKVAFLQRIKWHNWSAGAWKYLTWCQ